MSLSVFPRSFLVILSVLLLSVPAKAQDYRYSPEGPVYMRIYTYGTLHKTLSITNPTNDRLFVKVRYFGDTNIKLLYNSEYLYIGADSTANLEIAYTPTPGDTSYGWFRIFDSVTTPDTIAIIGMDTGTVFKPRAWWLAPQVLDLGSAFDAEDSGNVVIRNQSNQGITITAIVNPNSFGIQMTGASVRQVGPDEITTFAFNFLSSQYDTAEAKVVFSGANIKDSVWIRGRNQMPQPDSLHFAIEAFDTLTVGDTACVRAWLVNDMDTTAYVTSISKLAGAYFSLSNIPTLPFALAPNDTVFFDVCIIVPDTNGVFGAGFEVEYQFAGQSARTKTAWVNGIIPDCLSATGLDFGDVVRGSTHTGSFRVSNNRSYPVQITQIEEQQGGSSQITVLDQAPITISANGSVDIDVQLVAEGYLYPGKWLTLRSSCGREYVQIRAHIDDSLIVDSVATELFGDQNRTLRFQGDSTTLTHTFNFYNNAPDSITIVSVSLAQGTYFTISGILPSTPEFKLDSGEVMQVELTFTGNPGTYGDTLIIVTENGLIALSFPIEAEILGTQDVESPNVSGPEMLITPNPSSGPVTIELRSVSTAEVTILDALGRVIAQPAGRVLRWDASELPKGTYFIRAAGIGENRRPFVITQRVVIE